MIDRQRLSSSAFRISRLLMLGIVLGSPVSAISQEPAAAPGTTALPDSPQPKQQNSSNLAKDTTTKFVGYMSDKSFFFPDIADSPGPLNPGHKFKLFINQSISPPYLLAAAVSAGYSQARDVPSAYGQGWDAYGGRYGATMARAASGSFFGTFLFASAFRHDPRFFPQSHPSLWGSVKYSAQQIVVSRNDAGSESLNTSGLLGALAAEGLANAYLPVSEQTFGKTMERYGTDTAWKFAANMFRNYWPTIFHKFQLNRLDIIPAPQPADNPPAPRPN
jgi:hypothetical protein